LSVTINTPNGDGMRDVSRRVVIAGGIASLGLGAVPVGARSISPNPTGGPVSLPVTMQVNGKPVALALDPRTTLLDALREHLKLTGTKKGCDHGQCGACTVMVNGTRINACLTLAVMHEGDSITTIEGLARQSTCIRCRPPLSSMMAINADIVRRARSALRWPC
jgi:xanthine dehydrogenase YagT iron-sulfur-binding subunit